LKQGLFTIMRFTAATATLTLGAVVLAIPTAAPAKFAIQVSAKMGKDATTPETILYLAKGATGVSTKDLKEAASCSIHAETHLVCDGTVLGASLDRPEMDMAPLSPPKGTTLMTDGFSVDENMKLHWKSKDFPKLKQYKIVSAPLGALVDGHSIGQGGEARFGLFQSAMFTQGKPQLWALLGCPGGDHTTAAGQKGHDELWVGSAKAVPL
jgi:hypothetical protein